MSVGSLSGKTASRNTFLFIDNSNIFIEGQKAYSIHLWQHPPFDPRFRMNIKNLIQTVGYDTVQKLYIYGSATVKAAHQAVARQLEELGIECKVFSADRKRQHREKMVDVQLAQDMRALIFSEDRPKDGTIILMSGDADFVPVVQEGLKHGWKFQIFGWKDSVAGAYVRMQSKCLKIQNLDENKDKCFFLEHWDRYNRKVSKGLNRKILVWGLSEGVIDAGLAEHFDTIIGWPNTLSWDSKKKCLELTLSFFFTPPTAAGGASLVPSRPTQVEIEASFAALLDAFDHLQRKYGVTKIEMGTQDETDVTDAKDMQSASSSSKVTPLARVESSALKRHTFQTRRLSYYDFCEFQAPFTTQLPPYTLHGWCVPCYSDGFGNLYNLLQIPF